MRHEFKDLSAEFGPLLAFDATSKHRWAKQTFDTWVMGDGHLAEAEGGWCTWLECSGMRQFGGTVEVLVDEPPPLHAQYAVQRASDLWLRLPSGKLVLTSRTAVLADAEEYGDAFARELELPAGDYSVEIWSYISHELRLESTPLPTPQTVWSTIVNGLRFLMVLLTLLGVFFAIAAFQTSSPGWFAIDVAVIVAGWAAIEVLHRVSGAAANERQRDAEFARAIAALPPVPSFTLSLRKVDVPPARGGGASDEFVEPTPGEVQVVGSNARR